MTTAHEELRGNFRDCLSCDHADGPTCSWVRRYLGNGKGKHDDPRFKAHQRWSMGQNWHPETGTPLNVSSNCPEWQPRGKGKAHHRPEQRPERYLGHVVPVALAGLEEPDRANCEGCPDNPDCGRHRLCEWECNAARAAGIWEGDG